MLIKSLSRRSFAAKAAKAPPTGRNLKRPERAPEFNSYDIDGNLEFLKQQQDKFGVKEEKQYVQDNEYYKLL